MDLDKKNFNFQLSMCRYDAGKSVFNLVYRVMQKSLGNEATRETRRQVTSVPSRTFCSRSNSEVRRSFKI
jgi:hypothetical protein